MGGSILLDEDSAALSVRLSLQEERETDSETFSLALHV